MRFGPGVHFSASDVREGVREREKERQTEREGSGEKKRKGVSVSKRKGKLPGFKTKDFGWC